VDPPDGQMPALTQAGLAKQRESFGVGTFGNRPFNGFEDFSLYDRCITRGIGGIFPVLYGNGLRIMQTPNEVIISYEMIHDTRVIPLDGRPHVGAGIHQYMGDARGRWEGDTLVVETTNFTDKIAYRGSSEHLKLTERFTRTGPDTVEWSSTFNDPHTWATPWTFAMNLTRKDDSQRPFEYACHEGNYAMFHLLQAARADDKAAEEDAKKGIVRARAAGGADEQER
jgi:hypothetical protein